MLNSLKNIKIQLRTDDLSNWNEKNPILRSGEVAIVNADGVQNLKIGNGISSFTELKYIHQDEVKTNKVTTKDVTTQSLAQGFNVKATPTSIATGIFTRADGNFDVVHGIEAQALEGDDYAFVFNGENLPGLGTTFYTSHGEGTFNINALSGLSGIYIGERKLADILGQYFISSEISNYYTKDQITERDGAFHTEVSGISSQLEDEIAASSSSLEDKIEEISTSISFDLSNEIERAKSAEAAAQASGELSAQAVRDDLLNYSSKSCVEGLSGEFKTISSDFNSRLETDEQDIQDRATKDELSSQISALSSNTMAVASAIQASIPTKVSQLENDSGFTTNIGTITEVTMNGVSKGTSGVVDLGVVLTSHQSLESYYKSSETSSASQLTTAFSSKADKATTLAGYGITDAKIDGTAITLGSTTITALTAHQSLENYYTKSETSSATQIQSAKFLTNSKLSFSYSSETKEITLSGYDNQLIGSVDCTDFIKDGMLSTAYLSGDILVLKFNTDAETAPISIDLHKFVDNYDEKITYLSNAITADVKNLADNYYPKTETSSASELSDIVDSLQTSIASEVAAREDSDLTLSSAISSCYTKEESDALSTTFREGLAEKSTTLAGYGITDAKINGTAITLGSTTITALTAHQSLTSYETIADLTSNYYNKTSVNSLTSSLNSSITSLNSTLTSDYYTKSETSSATQIKAADDFLSSAIDIKVQIGSYADSQYDLTSADMKVVHISDTDYYNLVTSEDVLSNAIYIVSSDSIDAFGQQIVNVAEPTVSSDAATKSYVDDQISNVNDSIAAEVAAREDAIYSISQVLSGQSFDFSTDEGRNSALSALVTIFGGTVLNFPS